MNMQCSRDITCTICRKSYKIAVSSLLPTVRPGKKCGSYPRLPEGLTPHSQTDDKAARATPLHQAHCARHITTAGSSRQKGAVGRTVGAACSPTIDRSPAYMRHAAIACGRTDYTRIYYRQRWFEIHLPRN